MADVRGFLKYGREDFGKAPVAERLGHWREFLIPLPDLDLEHQAARCMDCGVPFCHWACPVSNLIPDWNDLAYRGRWQEALERLVRTNPFPEFTGRVCPAPCEHSCVLGVNRSGVTIKNIELTIIEKGFQNGWMKPRPPRERTGRRVAVVGSGPAGLSAADELNRAGHSVTVYEKSEFPGGLLALGIPDFKLEKSVIERRISLMREEGIEFKTGVHVGVSLGAEKLRAECDALLLASGAEQARDLALPGRELAGIYQAMDYLARQNRLNRGLVSGGDPLLSAHGRRVIVLGGGDTGADCVGTAARQGARSVRQYELLPEPPEKRTAHNPWPYWPLIQRTSSSHEEGCEREYAVLTKRFSGEGGRLKKLHAARLEYGGADPKTGRLESREIPGSEYEVEADLVLLALGFTGPRREGLIEELGLKLTERGNVRTDPARMTSVPGVFAAGDAARGQSLVVWAIHEGRLAARSIDQYLRKR